MSQSVYMFTMPSSNQALKSNPPNVGSLHYIRIKLYISEFCIVYDFQL